MTETKHTPGPWEARKVTGWGSDLVISSPNWPKPVATLVHHPDCYYSHVIKDGWVTFKETPEGEARKSEVEQVFNANARLIAAAPELLEAVKDAIFSLEIEFGKSGARTNFPKLYAAVDKAEGTAE